MQFLAALIVGVIAILMAMFFIPQIVDTLHVGSVLGTSTEAVVISAGEVHHQTAQELARTLPNATRFMELFDETHTADMLIATGTYTFFIPTNDALALMPLSTMTPEEKQRLVLYHIVPGLVTGEGQKMGWFNTLSRDQINTDEFDDGPLLENRHIVDSFSRPAGIVYIMDDVLLPPQRRPFPF